MSVDILGQAETSAEAWFNIALSPRKPGHLDSHTAPELGVVVSRSSSWDKRKYGGPVHYRLAHVKDHTTAGLKLSKYL